MGLDLYIKTKIIEKKTRKVITLSEYNREWITVLWTCGWSSAVICNSWIDIINRYKKTNHKYSDYRISFPRSALREMCSCLLSYGCIPESNRFDLDVECGFWDIGSREKNIKDLCNPKRLYDDIPWESIQDDEHWFLTMGKRLLDFIYFLDKIQYENEYVPLKTSTDGLSEYGEIVFVDDLIKEKSDLEKFKENPRAYEWKFMLVNSY